MQLCINYSEIIYEETHPARLKTNGAKMFKNIHFCFTSKTLCLDFALFDEERSFNLQAVQVRHSLHPSHLSQGFQVVQERCPLVGLLGAPAVPGGHEALEAPDQTRRHISVTQKGK